MITFSAISPSPILKHVEDEQFTQYTQNDFLPINLTSLVISNWSNPKLQEIIRGAEVFKAMCWKGTATFKEGHTYTGSMRNGKMHGDGKFVWKDGTIFEGKFRKNEITGFGKYTWPDGTTYEGEVKDGIRNGKGVFTNSKEGYKYEGEWKNGLRHGKGVLSYHIEEGDEEAFTGYDGLWENGEKCGYGKYVYPSGNYYEGEWMHNKRNGKGTMYWQKIGNRPTNEKYVGQWKDDLQSGFGTHIWLDERSENKVLRNRYVGYWKNGAREGHGIFFYANGGMYIGQWKENMKDGWGKFIFEDGTEFEGKYSKDRLIDTTGPGKTLTAGIQAASDAATAQALYKEIEKNSKLMSKPPAKNEKGKEPAKPAAPRQRPEVESNPYSTMLDSSDLLSMEQYLHPENTGLPIKKSGQSPTLGGQFAGKPKEIQEEINNLILTYNSELKQWYKYFTNIDRIDFEEGFMMVSRQFWRFLEVCKILNVGFPLSQFNRIYLRGKKTFFSLKYNPFYGSDSKKDEWRPATPELDISKKDNKTGAIDQNPPEDKKEDLSLEKADKSSLLPIKPYDTEHLPNANFFDNVSGMDQIDITDEELPIEDIEPFEKEDVHDQMRPMLFRHFVEGIIRAAYLYYINDSGSLKSKLNSLFTDKLKPNLPEVAKRGKRKDFVAPKPGLVYSYEELLKPYDKDLFSLFKLYSRQSKLKIDNFFDYTLSVTTLKNMLEIVIGKEATTIDLLLKLLEVNFDEGQRYFTIQNKEGIPEENKKQMGEEYIRALMSYEMIYYEFKGIILELIKHIKKTDKITAAIIKDFVNDFIEKLKKKETRTKLPYKRSWKVSEKEIK